MKYLLFLFSSMLSLSLAFGEINLSLDQDLEAHGHKDISSGQNNQTRAFGSYVSEMHQTIGPNTADIQFEVTLDSKNITQESNLSTFIIQESGTYTIDYGVSITIGGPNQPGVFSIHKNGSKVLGTEMGNVQDDFLSSYAVILHLNKGDAISLSLDTFGSLGQVIVIPPQPNANSAYIAFHKIK